MNITSDVSVFSMKMKHIEKYINPTLNLMINLSSIFMNLMVVAGPVGFEPTAPGLEGRLEPH